MALYKMKEFYPNYRDLFSDHDILSYDLYSGNDKVGSIDDLLVDEAGKFRYFIINTGIWVFGKKVLLPIGQTQIDYNNRRIYANDLTREQVENLPAFDPDKLNYEHEEQVRNVYRPTATRNRTMGTAGVAPNARVESSTPLESSTSLESSAPLTGSAGTYDRTVDRPIDRKIDRTLDRDADRDLAVNRTYDRDTYRYDYDPDLYNYNDREDHRSLKLYEERLIANTTRQKTGEVAIGKHIETETANVSVPVEKERVVIERSTPMNAGAVTADATAFNEGEVARVEVYEETPDIRKETVVREEVNVRKEVDRDTVEASDTIRKERLDINKEGNPIVNDRD